MKKVSYKTVLRDLYEDTDLQNMKLNEIYLSRLIRKADKRIAGLYTVNTDSKAITVENSSIGFPPDMFNVDYVLIGDYTDKNVYFLNQDTDFIVNIELTEFEDNIDSYKLWSDISYVIESNKIDFVIANGQINIDPVYNGQIVTLVYTCYPKNDKGEILLNENHVDPIIRWIKCHVFERQMFKKKMSGGRLFQDDFGFLRQLKSDKNREIRNARVNDRNLNEEFTSKNIIINSYNAMIEHDSY